MIVPQPNPKRDDKRRAESIKLAFAFAAIYIVWGSTYLAIRYAVETIRRSSPQAFVTVWPGVFCWYGRVRGDTGRSASTGLRERFSERCFF